MQMRVRSTLSITRPCSGRSVGRTFIRSAKKLMLTMSATSTRACSCSSSTKSTHPVSASLRHISSGSHQKAKGL